MNPFTEKQEKPRTQGATILDVAKHAGVSKTTVSRYLGGQYHVLATETRKRIEQAIHALDYRPNQMARGLKGNRSYLIGIVLADIRNPYSTAILRGAEDVCKRNSYSLMVCNTDNDPVKEREYIRNLQSHRIDGLIINTTGHNNPFLYDLAADQTPIVLVDRKIPELSFDMIGIDNQHATAEAIRFLVDQGYKRIAFFSEPLNGLSSRTERVTTFRRMMDQYEANHVSGVVYEVDLAKLGQVDAALTDFLCTSNGTTPVLFAGNGVMLLQLILALHKKGLQIPEDLAVAGFDNVDWAAIAGNGITTIAQPTYEIGVLAMERVLKRIEGEALLPQTIELATELIVRGSTPKLSTVAKQ